METAESCPSCGAPLPPSRFPRCTADAILLFPGRRVLLVRRRYPPIGWALPGGFVEAGESLEDACRREIEEETAIVIEHLEQFHTYSDPRRDPRRHTITTVFVASGRGDPRAGDDAAETALFPLADLPDPLCFDHRRILDDYIRARRPSDPPSA